MSADTDRTLVIPGELRPDLIALLGVPSGGIDCLLTAPGLLEGWTGSGELARDPRRAFSSSFAYSHRQALMASFVRGVDALPRTKLWADGIRLWCDALGDGRIRARHADRFALFTRMLSIERATLLPMAPMLVGEPPSPELKIELTGTQHVRARAWFGELFAQSVDVSAEMLRALQGSWAVTHPSPRDLYYKTLIEYFRELVEGADVEADDNRVLEALTDFQQSAYVAARTILRRYGGVFLSDVVGLGKTFIALALLSHFQQRYQEHAVVVAPPAVLPAWKALASEYRVELATVSIGSLEELTNYADREIVVVDESHNFRNTDTQRYEALQQFLRPDSAPSTRKVLLLSATPQNNRPEDLKHQLQLFPDNYRRLPYRAESIDAWFRQVAAREASLVDLLQHVVVSRTRRFIQQVHPDATLRVRLPTGEYIQRPLRFPRRVSGDEQTLRYSLDETYGGRLYDSLLRAFQSLRYPLHGLGLYALDSAAAHPVVGRLRRSGGSVRGLFKVLLLKRLESSIVALHGSLDRLHGRLLSARKLLDEGFVLAGATQLVASEEADGEAIPVDGVRIPVTLFQVERLRADIEHDLAEVALLYEKTSALKTRPDPKLECLRRYLVARPPSQHRTIVFTQFADTATHLGEGLGQRFGRMLVTVGGGADAIRAARRFAPVANRTQVPSDEQIDLLTSTDALSEGVNLQDADTLINYDIHWNPVRLIQRAGRIDRIGSEHDEIHVASFLPERALEAQLGIEAVLRRRIHEFVTVFGEDSLVLPASEQPDEVASFNAYTGAALVLDEQQDDGMDALSRHSERLLVMKRSEPSEYARILQLRLGLHASGAGSHPVVAIRHGWFWRFWTARSSRRELEQLDPLCALDIMHEHAELGPEGWPGSDALGLIESVRAAFQPLAEQFQEQRKRPRLSAPESYALQQLDAYVEKCPSSQQPLVNDIRAWIRQGHAQDAIARHGRKWRRERVSPFIVFEETRALMARYPAREEIFGDPELVAAILVGEMTAD